jgi:serine/threonine protein kinase
MIGQIISNYEVKSLLGAGGMGTVYLAEHIKLGRKVAIKSLHPQFVNSEEIRVRFIHEAKVMAELQHPNIVTLYDYVETETGLFLIIELVDGKPIDDYIEQVSGPIEEGKAIEMMNEILEGFQYAHEKGLVHRDIKPSNLVIAAKNKVKILDFGIAKLVGDTSSKMTKTGTHIGTVYYMSPEQVKGDDLDQRSDIYALGVTFFQMLTGNSPYKGMTKEFDVFMKIVNEELPDPRTIYPGVSEHMCAVIQKATAKDANERFQTCEEFAAALNEGFTAEKEQIVASTEKEDFQSLENYEELNPVTAMLADLVAKQFSASAKTKKETTKVENDSLIDDTKSKTKASKTKIYAIIGSSVALLGLIIYILVYVSMNLSEFKNDETEKELISTIKPTTWQEKSAYDYLTDNVLNSSEDFEILARKFSQDTLEDSFTGMKVNKGELPDEYDLMVDELNVGEISPIFELFYMSSNPEEQHKYVIIKLLEKSEGFYKIQYITRFINLEIGQYYQGGIIFQIDDKGEHGKICAKSDLGMFNWKDAKQKCEDIELNGYSDWNLPSKGELEKLYQLRNDIGGFSSYYWSSSEYDKVDAWAHYFYDGTQDFINKFNSNILIRAVRTF